MRLGQAVDKSELYVGIMSGTSLDGIDTALLDFSGSAPRLLATHYQAYPEALKETLLALHHPMQNELHHTLLIANELAQGYATAVHSLLLAADVRPNQVRAIGCHGQTIRHRPAAGYTVQLGNAALLAELSGITVVNDFRSRDIAAGGQGAPLVPAFHHKMLRHSDIHRVIVNIGGISNLTNLPPGQVTSGFDCGPGNLLMDAWIKQHLGQSYDRDGAWAATGTVIPALLHALLDEPYMLATPPKSCGRDLFNMRWLEQKLHGDEAPADVQATLLALTGEAISAAILRYCLGAKEVYLCGGGAHNLALINYLEKELVNCRIQLTDQLGIEADWLEAIAFAWLAQQTLQGNCANLPEATGARHPCILGAIYQA
ncbi:MAG TPA: anhydro-N-acetylmuramic acid kinase [Gallionellaceae bacterium]|nr:anhydro-N-acetylmuramic acid kinase [Gallionellaceae bacterium]